ncbi:MAG TPA: helix-turn-helix transcriptional regulator [Methylomirabilota bacterium]|nr:helix-turn-helix transcriptional regulator [Methylomirabilota bacterium]
MAKPFRMLTEHWSPERKRRVAEKADTMLREMALDELRAARNLTQEQLAKKLGVAQAAVSKMERRTDMYISTLETAIKAMGGQLEIRAIFPGSTVTIHQFREIERPTRRRPKRRRA